MDEKGVLHSVFVKKKKKKAEFLQNVLDFLASKGKNIHTTLY